MKNRTFLAFVAPSALMMLLFMAFPLASVLVQSFYVTRDVYEQVKIETCSPGFIAQTCVEELKTRAVLGPTGLPLTQTLFAGWDVYKSLLKPEAVSAAFAPGGGGFGDVLKIDFYRALRFTLTFTFVTLPLMLMMALALAIAVNATLKSLRGGIIFISLLPFVVTPVIGALSVRWLFVGDGILTAGLQSLLDRKISIFAEGWSIELLMLFYGVLHVTPFAFVIFYAALQTLNQDTLESAIVDGASRTERLRYVILPHLMPLIVFVSLIHLMDSYRVFEEVIGFSSEAHRISLQWLTYNFLVPDNSGNRAISSASASSMLTMIGIVILLVPLLLHTWRDHRRAG